LSDFRVTFEASRKISHHLNHFNFDKSLNQHYITKSVIIVKVCVRRCFNYLASLVSRSRASVLFQCWTQECRFVYFISSFALANSGILLQFVYSI